VARWPTADLFNGITRSISFHAGLIAEDHGAASSDRPPEARRGHGWPGPASAASPKRRARRRRPTSAGNRRVAGGTGGREAWARSLTIAYDHRCGPGCPDRRRDLVQHRQGHGRRRASTARTWSSRAAKPAWSPEVCHGTLRDRPGLPGGLRPTAIEAMPPAPRHRVPGRGGLPSWSRRAHRPVVEPTPVGIADAVERFAAIRPDGFSRRAAGALLVRGRR
jgi:hypothetical protein